MNPYKIIGVTENATTAEIKKAYKRKAQELHPDRETGCEEKFQELQDAYAILKDENRRAIYDETGQTDQRYSEIGDHAAAMLIQMFMQLLHGKDCRLMDYTVEIRERLVDNVDDAKKECKKIGERIDKLQALLERLTCKEGDNLFGTAMETTIAESEKQYSEGQLHIKITEAALERLDKYGFEGLQELPTSKPKHNFFDPFEDFKNGRSFL